MFIKVPTTIEIQGCVCTHVYLDGDAPVNPGHVEEVRLPVGQVTLVHVDGERRLQPSQVIPHL